MKFLDGFMLVFGVLWGLGASAGTKGALAGHEGVQLWENGPYWATVNCGAEKEGQVGSYYFNWNDTVGYTVTGGALTGKLVKNAGTTFWTGGWRKPTLDEIKAMIANCHVVETKDFDGQPCVKVCGKNAGYADNFVWFPLAGWGNGGNAGPGNAWGSMGKYWAAGDKGILQHLITRGNGLGTAAGGADHGNYYTLRLVCDAVTDEKVKAPGKTARSKVVNTKWKQGSRPVPVKPARPQGKKAKKNS